MTIPETPSDARTSTYGRLEIQSGKPLRFVEHEPPAAGIGAPSVEETEARTNARRVAATIKAYRAAAQALLAGKYADIRAYAPTHLRDPCATTVVYCTDGILIRYDAAEVDEPRVRSAAVAAPLAQIAPQFSDSLIHFTSDPASYDPGPGGIEFHLAKFDLGSGDQEPLGTMRLLMYVNSTTPAPHALLPPPHRPTPLVSVSNEVEILFSGIVLPSETHTAPQAIPNTQDFVARGTMTLQVGWRAIEVYPRFEPAYWNVEYASLWAETDLLAAAARRQSHEAQFTALDPNLGARKMFALLIAELEALLHGPEEPAHQFLKAHPALLSPTHIAAWSKLPFGDRVSDFVFREPGGEYLLVEIESPLRRLFRKDGQQRQELTHAFNQILDWRVYLESNLGDVRDRLGLSGISSNPKSMIVIGRTATLTEGDRLKLTTLQNQIPNLRILTYDDLIKHAKAVAENLFGPLGIMTSNGEIYFASPRPDASSTAQSTGN